MANVNVPPHSFTLLDALFYNTSTPVEAKNVSKAWLQKLADEGYNIAAYLQKEFELRSKHRHFTSCEFWYRCRGGLPRRLSFELGCNPSVSWDWWIDPESPTFPLRTTFRDMTMLSFWHQPVPSGQWHETWPFVAPAWSWQYNSQ